MCHVGYTNKTALNQSAVSVSSSLARLVKKKNLFDVKLVAAAGRRLEKPEDDGAVSNPDSSGGACVIACLV